MAKSNCGGSPFSIGHGAICFYGISNRESRIWHVLTETLGIRKQKRMPAQPGGKVSGRIIPNSD